MYLYDCTLFSILLPTSFLLCIPLPYPIWSFSIICCYRVIYYRILLFWSHSYLIWSYLYVELAVFLQNCKTIYLSIWLFLLWLRMQRLFELFRRPTVILPYWNTIYYNDYIYTVTTAQLWQAKELCPTRLRLNAAVTQIDTGSRRQSISTWKPSFSQISCDFKNRSQHLKTQDVSSVHYPVSSLWKCCCARWVDLFWFALRFSASGQEMGGSILFKQRQDDDLVEVLGSWASGYTGSL